MGGEEEGNILLSRLDSELGRTGVVKSLRPYKPHPADSSLLTSHKTQAFREIA